LNLLAACAFGLEAIVKRELISLGYEDAHVAQPGRIRFAGDWSAVCRANMWLRTADRVLVEVLCFEAADFDALFDTVKEYDWSQFLPANAKFPVDGKSRRSTLTSVPAIQRTVKKAMVDSLLREHNTNQLDESGELFRIEVALLDDIATITLDTTGPSLHKRGYRKLSAEAPLKETLAAALISLSVWNPKRVLIDPFCGSGTIPIEAAMIGLNIAPGLYRSFSASHWPSIGESLWMDAKNEATEAIDRNTQLQILGCDRDAEVLGLAKFHAERAGVSRQITLRNQAFEALNSEQEYGCIVTNPPYGERLEDQQKLIGLYESIPFVVTRLPTWSLYLITNMPQFEKLIQKRATRRRKLYNGRIECTYYQFLGPRPPKGWANDGRGFRAELSKEDDSGDLGSASSSSSPSSSPPSSLTEDDEPKIESVEDVRAPAGSELGNEVAPARETVAPVFTGLQPKDHEQAELFKSRLAKRARHLRRWPTKRGITCFRLYEKDIPEIPLVVDRYEDNLHITEYERPHDRDLARHAGWLELMKNAASETLNIPSERIFVKRRMKNRDRNQYKKFDTSGNLITVQEDGLKFLVNLTDYVDTGLFLDHRQTRKMVRQEADHKDVLNLFAYTGSFTVYAAAGGARSTTTVDLSRTYLDWAKENMTANDLDGTNHQYVAADSIDFLRRAAKDLEECFDLVIADPPTYSNSKRTENDWDVQKCHAEMLQLIQPTLREGGVVYFSTNFRRFKLAEAELTGYDVREISKQTVPEDFRNQRIHRCWRMVAK
jgi:23S rRNA (guanine2445-N2)-methyltransferase / 23S rRNA (guanine2069-N7)-methyltransferase